jgi:Skp family chaperone for outer membrane proteins
VTALSRIPKSKGDHIRKDAPKRQGELMKMAERVQRDTELLKEMPEGEKDRAEARLKALRDDLGAAQNRATEEFTRREAVALREMQEMITAVFSRIAKERNLTLVVQVVDKEIDPGKPQSVQKAFSAVVLYAAPGLDITDEVVAGLHNL